MIRVLIKASSAIARAGLESLLRAQRGIELADGELATLGREAALESPQTVLVAEADTVADSSAREAVEWAGVGGAAILLLRNPAPESIVGALRTGIKAVLQSNLPGLDIVKAIEAAAAGFVVLDGGGLEGLLQTAAAVSIRGANNLAEALTPREVEVLRLVAAGLGNKEIASRLGISEHTVKFHVASVMGKLGASSRTEAVTLGIRHGLVMI
jgi:two-component system, NarL family, response regulator YdfI